MGSIFHQLVGLRSKDSPSSQSEQNYSIPSVNGTCGLPVELWEEIFKTLFAQITDLKNLATEFQDTTSTYTSLICETSILSTIDELQRPQLFATRRAVVLVCKSWHQTMISTLRSHICINMSKESTKLDGVCSTLSSTPSFASAVLRLSIQQGVHYASYRYDPNFDKPRSRIIARILPLLTNLRVLVCPTVLMRALKDHLRPEILIVGESLGCSVPHYVPLFHQTPIWNYIRTLSLQLREEREVYDEHSTPTQFLNLVNLRLEVWKISVIQWIGHEWEIGKPRTLSIARPSPQSWLGLIRRCGQELEALELVPLEGGHLYMSPPDLNINEVSLELFNLKKLCLYHPLLVRSVDPAAKLLSDLKAPKLTRLCYHILSLKSHGREFYRIAERVEASLKIWPRLEELVISCHRDTDALSEERVVGGTRLVVSTAEMRNWCERGIRVTIKEKGSIVMELDRSEPKE